MVRTNPQRSGPTCARTQRRPANLAKHFAFTRCGELNLNGMVEAQTAALEGELLAGNTDVF